MELALARDGLAVVELVGWSVQLLDLVAIVAKLVKVFRRFVNFEMDFDAELLLFAHLL